MRSSPPLEDFPHRTTDIIRFGDLDPQGHVNNAVYSTYFETGRGEMFRAPDLGVGIAGATFVLVHTEISFLRELSWPGTVDIGTAVTRIGRTSFTLAQAVYCRGTCAATGSATMVLVDKVKKTPQPLPESAIARLSQWAWKNHNCAETTKAQE